MAHKKCIKRMKNKNPKILNSPILSPLLSLLDLLSDAILLVLFSSKIVFNELALHSKMAT
jgi:hypothetical protein